MKKNTKNGLLSFVFLSFLLLLSCDSQGKESIFRSVSVEDASALLQSRVGVQLLDVRTVEEFGRGFIEGAALIPISSLPDQKGSLNKDAPILVYCAVGARSYAAGKYLQSTGFLEVYSMSGGIKEWYEKGFPVKLRK